MRSPVFQLFVQGLKNAKWPNLTSVWSKMNSKPASTSSLIGSTSLAFNPYAASSAVPIDHHRAPEMPSGFGGLPSKPYEFTQAERAQDHSFQQIPQQRHQQQSQVLPSLLGGRSLLACDVKQSNCEKNLSTAMCERVSLRGKKTLIRVFQCAVSEFF